MKNFLIYICIIIWGIINFNTSFAQVIDTSAIILITNFNNSHPDTLEFDIMLERTTDKWDRFANATFTFRINDLSAVIPDGKYKLRYMTGTTQLNLGAVFGLQIPSSDYNLYYEIIKDTINMTVLGPENYGNCTFVPYGGKIRLGRFQIYHLVPSDGSYSIPSELQWLMPTLYYQASAFKLPIDTEVKPGVNSYRDDNIELEDWCAQNVAYKSDIAPEPCMKLKYFNTDYVGTKSVAITWETECEKYNKGFILRRGQMPFGANDINLVNFDLLIGRYDGPLPKEKNLIGLGTRTPGAVYNYPDTATVRGSTYCYKLSYIDFFWDEHELAIKCVPIPFAVISYAQPNPNPFSSSTKIRFKVDDDVILSAFVYDLSGREVGFLVENGKEINKIEIKIGWHEAEFIAPELAVAGMYQIIFIAYPIDDPSVELSHAVIKVQLIR